MSTYFNPVPLEVIPLDLAKADDLNLYGTSLDAAFDLVEADIIDINDDAELWAGVSQKWATEAEDVEVEVGKYSSLHWAAKSEDEAIAAGGYAANALVSENNSAASEASCDADVVLTHADVVLTHADVVLTHADVTLTHADVVLTDANAIQTSDDVDATNADVVLTGLDAIDTALDVVATNADVLLTNADAVSTGLDVVATNADVVSTGLDVIQTGADVIAASDSAADALASEVAAALSALEASNSTMGIIDKLLTSINAVDICFHDTTEYRDRCSHTSWENEELNTATRGATAKIPARVTIIAEVVEVTLYDLTDSDVPMWRVHDFTGYTITSVEMLNGKLVVGTTTGLYVYDYISTEENWYTTELVNTTVNGVAMTVLPDAPVDPATGVQVPTQAVPTATGGSWIKDDGTIVDATGAINLVDADINTDGMTAWAASDKLYIFDSIPTVDTALTSADYIFDTAGTSAPHVSGVISSVKLVGSDIIVGTDEGVFQIKYNPTTPANSITNQTTIDFPSGGLVADIKGAWLADTDDTDLVGSELVTDGTFDTACGVNWICAGGWSIGGGTATNTPGVSANIIQDVLTIGERYVLEFEITRAVAGILTVRLGVDTYSAGFNTTGVKTFTGICTGSTELWIRAGSTFDGDVDNVTLRLADADRSVNDNGLAVHGTIARNPVATGAELVAYSGFSVTNYLEQPHNTDLDFGTGDFHVMGWLIGSNTTYDVILECGSDTASGYAGNGFMVFSDSIANTLTIGTHFGATASIAGYAPLQGNLDFFVGVRKAGVLSIYINGVLLSTGGGVFQDISFTGTETLRIGGRHSGLPLDTSSLALVRVAAGAPSAEQIEYIHNWEKKFFAEDAKCTLAGTSDSIISLAYDKLTEELGVVTSYGKSILKDGLLVDEEATTVGTPTCLAMDDGDTAFGGTTGVAVYSPAESLRAELLKQEVSNPLGFEPFWFVGDAVITDFVMEVGWKPKFVYDGGMLVKDGASDEYEIIYDGFIYTVSFAVAPANGNDVCVMGVR